MHLGQNIKYLRKLRGLTQKDLAKEIGMTHSAISSYEQGNNEPTAGVLKKIGTALNASVDDILYKDLANLAGSDSDQKSMLSYAQDLEAGRKTVDEVEAEVGDVNLKKIIKLLELRVNELEMAIREQNPELADKLKID